MSDQEAPVVEEVTEDDDFNAGFEGTEIPTETPEPEAEASAPVEEIAPPKLAAITEDEYQKLLAHAAEIDALKAHQEKAFGTAFGKIGGIERTINERLKAVPANVNLTPQTLKRLNSNFPELSADLAADLSEALQAQLHVSNNLDQSQIDQMVQAKLGTAIQDVQEQVEKATEVKFLTRQHRDWREVVAQNEFKAWVSSQPADFQKQLNETWDSMFISDALDKFKESRQPKVEIKPTARQKRFEAAIQPKGIGGHSAGRSDDDDFNAGFYGTS